MVPISDNRAKTALVSSALFLLTMAFVATRTGRDALYLQGDGLRQVPGAYILIALLAIPQAMIVLRLLRRFGGQVTRVLLLVVVTVALCGFYVVARAGASAVMTAFFAFVPLAFSILFSTVWLLGAEMFETELKDVVASAFSRFGAASISGGVAGALLARVAGPALGPRGLLLVGAGLVAATTGVVLLIHARFALGDRTGTPDGGASSNPPVLPALHRLPNLGLLLGVSMIAAFTAIFIDFQFYLAVASGDRDSEAMTVFFANVYLALQGASLILQLVVTPRLQRHLGLGGSLLVLPTALFAGTAAMITTSAIAARAGLRITEGGLKAGVHRSTWEQAFLVFPRASRARAKVLIDGLGARLAEGLAAAALYVWLVYVIGDSDISRASTAWVSGSLVGGTVVWLALTRVLARRLAAGDIAADDEPCRAPLPDS
jgi:AAA family ATP:ADP antiporter